MREVVLEGPRGDRLRCRVADGLIERVRGLLGVTAVAADEAILLLNATSIHTLGMRTPILVARLDAQLRVLDVRRVPPRRILFPRRRARHVLEGSVALDLRSGDVLRMVGGPSGG